VIIVTLKSIRLHIEMATKAFDFHVEFFSIEDDGDCDTLDSLRIIKDSIKVYSVLSILLVFNCAIVKM